MRSRLTRFPGATFSDGDVTSRPAAPLGGAATGVRHRDAWATSLGWVTVHALYEPSAFRTWPTARHYV